MKDLTSGCMTEFTENDVEIIRFALSFLLANLYDAVFADFDEKENAIDWAGTPDELAVRVQALHTIFESENEYER